MPTISWIDALRQYNAGMPSWCIPRRGTPAYDMIARIRQGEKPKSFKELTEELERKTGGKPKGEKKSVTINLAEDKDVVNVPTIQTEAPKTDRKESTKKMSQQKTMAVIQPTYVAEGGSKKKEVAEGGSKKTEIAERASKELAELLAEKSKLQAEVKELLKSSPLDDAVRRKLDPLNRRIAEITTDVRRRRLAETKAAKAEASKDILEKREELVTRKDRLFGLRNRNRKQIGKIERLAKEEKRELTDEETSTLADLKKKGDEYGNEMVSVHKEIRKLDAELKSKEQDAKKKGTSTK